MRVQGRVVIVTFGKGTKSECPAAVVVTPTGPYVLRLPGTNPFEVPPSLMELVGREVVCHGVGVEPNTLILARIAPVDADQKSML